MSVALAAGNNHPTGRTTLSVSAIMGQGTAVEAVFRARAPWLRQGVRGKEQWGRRAQPAECATLPEVRRQAATRDLEICTDQHAWYRYGRCSVVCNQCNRGRSRQVGWARVPSVSEGWA